MMHRLNDVRATLADADDNYTLLIEAGDHPAIDRVGYIATTRIDFFRRVLARPDLQVDELAGVLRAARRDIWPTSGDAADVPAPRVVPMGQPVHARIPKPIQAPPVIDGLNDWTIVMARFVMRQANEG